LMFDRCDIFAATSFHPALARFLANKTARMGDDAPGDCKRPLMLHRAMPA
jgi:hypothetical protein